MSRDTILLHTNVKIYTSLKIRECVRGGENVIEGKEMFLKKRKEMVKG